MRKSTVISVVVFAALLAGVIYMMSQKSERGIQRVSLAKVDTGQIDAVVITGKNPTELKKQGEQWLLADGRQADPGAVKRLLEAVPNIESSTVVTRDEKRFGEYETNDEKGVVVKLSSKGKNIAEFTVGKSASGGAYVKMGDSVYLVKKIYPYVFSKKSESWYKLKLFDTKLDEVVKVEVALAGQKPYGMVKKDEGEWLLMNTDVVEKGFRFDSSKGRSLASSLVNARAKKIVTESLTADQTGLGEGADKLTFTDKQGKTFALLLGKEQAPEEKKDADDKKKPKTNLDVYAQVQGQTDVVLLASYSVKNMRKAPLDLRDMKVMDLDKDQVSKLTIVDGKKRLVFEKKEDAWQIAKHTEKKPDNFDFDPTLVNSRIAALANARAMKLAQGVNKAKAGLSKPMAYLSALLKDGKEIKLVFGKNTKVDDRAVVYLAGNADDKVYLATEHTRKNLTGGITTFKRRPPPPSMGGGGFNNISPDALNKLPPEVRKSLMQQMQQKQQQQQMLRRIQSQAGKKKQ